MGKGAFDAVGPLLLIGWAEVGPGLLQAISGVHTGEPATSASLVIEQNPAQAAPRLAGASVPGAKDSGSVPQEHSEQPDQEAIAEDDLLERAREEDA